MSLFIIVGCILMLLLIGMSFRDMNSRQRNAYFNEKNEDNKMEKEDQQNTNGSLNSPKLYASDNFTVTYPTSYEIVTVAPVDPIIENIKLKKGSNINIEVTVVPNSKNIMESLLKPLRQGNYKEETIEINGMKGSYFEEEIADLSLYKRIVYLEKSSVIIKVQLTQVGEIEQEADQQFTSILESIK